MNSCELLFPVSQTLTSLRCRADVYKQFSSLRLYYEKWNISNHYQNNTEKEKW